MANARKAIRSQSRAWPFLFLGVIFNHRKRSKSVLRANKIKSCQACVAQNTTRARGWNLGAQFQTFMTNFRTSSKAAQVPKNGHANGAAPEIHLNGHANGHIEYSKFVNDIEPQLLALMKHRRGVARQVCKQSKCTTRADFNDEVAGCAYGACTFFCDDNKDPNSLPFVEVLQILEEWSREKTDNAPVAMQAIELWKSLEEPNVPQDDAATVAISLARQIKERSTQTQSSTRKSKITEKTKGSSVKEFVFEFSTDLDLDNHLTDIEWEWPNFIPRGFVTAIVGDQEQGKSMVAQGLCDIKLRGTRWPDGQPHTPSPDTKLLWIDTEGSIAIFYDRVKQWQMPRGRFILPSDPLRELTVDDHESWTWIEAAIEKFHPPIVVVDALSGAHKSKESGNDEMKVVMKKLAGLAQQHNIAVLVIHHLSKPAPGMPTFPISIHRLRGASAIPQYCRSILAVGAPDPARPLARRLDVIKLNLAPKPAPVGYELTNVGPAWGEAPEAPRQRRAVDDAIDFLSIALANGMRPSDEVTSEAKANNIGMNALTDARKALKVKAKREGGKDGRWYWYPPEKTVKAFNEDEEQ